MKEDMNKKAVPMPDNTDQKDAAVCSTNDCGISFRGTNFIRRDR